MPIINEAGQQAMRRYLDDHQRHSLDGGKSWRSGPWPGVEVSNVQLVSPDTITANVRIQPPAAAPFIPLRLHVPRPKTPQQAWLCRICDVPETVDLRSITLTLGSLETQVYIVWDAPDMASGWMGIDRHFPINQWQLLIRDSGFSGMTTEAFYRSFEINPPAPSVPPYRQEIQGHWSAVQVSDRDADYHALDQARIAAEAGPLSVAALVSRDMEEEALAEDASRLNQEDTAQMLGEAMAEAFTATLGSISPPPSIAEHMRQQTEALQRRVVGALGIPASELGIAPGSIGSAIRSHYTPEQQRRIDYIRQQLDQATREHRPDQVPVLREMMERARAAADLGYGLSPAQTITTTGTGPAFSPIPTTPQDLRPGDIGLDLATMPDTTRIQIRDQHGRIIFDGDPKQMKVVHALQVTPLDQVEDKEEPSTEYVRKVELDG